MTFFVSISTIFLSLFSIFFSTLVFGSIRHKVKNPIVVDFVAYLTVMSLLFWHFMPAFLRLISDFKFERQVGIGLTEILNVYLLEFISLSFFYITILLCFRVNKLRLTYLKFNTLKRVISSNKNWVLGLYLNNNTQLKFFIFFSKVMVILGVYALLQKFMSVNITIIPAIDFLLIPIVSKAPLLFLIHLLFISNIKKNNLLYLFTLCIFLIDGISDGSHGNVIALVIFLIFYNIFHNRDNKILCLIMISLMFFLAYYGDMHKLRSYAKLNDSTSVIEKIDYLVFSEDEVTSTNMPGGEGLLDRVEWRFGENSRKSAGYIRMYDKGESANIQPILNSLYVLPRSWLAYKPTPGSVDGTALGIGMRLMHKEIEGTKMNMSGFFTGLHSYWEFGLSGVFFISIFSGIYSSIILKISGNYKYLGLPLIVTLYSTWWQMPKLWSSEVFVQLFTVFIPIIIVWYVMFILYKFFFLLLGKNHNY